MDFTPRQRLWIALSDLFLDTDVSLSYDHILEVMTQTGFTDDEVQEILLYEVEPALCFNLYDVAGEWAGFEEHWLIDRIEEIRSKPRPKWVSWLTKSTYARAQWQALLKRRDSA
jgi:hypothetical protein